MNHVDKNQIELKCMDEIKKSGESLSKHRNDAN